MALLGASTWRRGLVGGAPGTGEPGDGAVPRAAVGGAERLAEPDRRGPAPVGAPGTPGAAEPGRFSAGYGFDNLVAAVLDDDPGAGAAAISAAIERWVALAEVGRAVAHAAALRLAHSHQE